ncbi:NosD domain-containing protein [Rhizobium lusitanum]|uniref:NosD domain-containing protein n=1 Tax=Rhizobium lusitanum TaxID=293958 RepID=UPI00195AB4B5|nr:NosD domain-containing protein [Rhizobium lusitanum]MBM7045220.1 hypothetical protein [Rhizobium lusitanum]
MRVARRLAGIGADDLTTTAAFDAYVGPSREVTVDPARGLIKLHDGSTAGGIFPTGLQSSVVSRAALAALDTTQVKVTYLKEAGREGAFIWVTGDKSAQITADTAQGLFVKATAIAATSGAWQRVYTGPISPLWFGATIDGVNSATAFGAFIDAMTFFGIAGELPAGIIDINGAVTRNIGAKPFVLRGLGRDISKLRFNSGSGGFDITATSDAAHTQIQRCIEATDFMLLTSQAGGGEAFKLTISPTIASSVTNGFRFDIAVRGDNVAADYWNSGIHVFGGWNGDIVGCDIKGLDDATYPFDMEDGIFLEQCNDCRVNGNRVYHANKGVHHKTTVVSYGDGTTINDNRFVGVGYGIYGDSTVAIVEEDISGNHINAYVSGINMTNLSSTPVTKNLIYKTNLSSQLDWSGIGVANGSFNSYVENQIGTPGAPAVASNFGIILSNCNDEIVGFNSFVPLTAGGTFYGVFLSGTSDRCSVFKNKGHTGVITNIVGSNPTSLGKANTFDDNKPLAAAATAFAANDATPSVGNDLNGQWKTANSSATSITTLDDMALGQIVRIQINDTNTTFVYSANFALRGGVNVTAPAGAGFFIEFMKTASGVISEIGRGF